MITKCEKLLNENDRLSKHVEMSISEVKKAQKDGIAKKQKEIQRKQEAADKIVTDKLLNRSHQSTERKPEQDATA